jgi:thiamine biosynthesis lipoprotein
MSPFRPNTEISRFNAMKSTKSTPVSEPFQNVVAESVRIAALSGGAFDPTVGPLVNRYGFGPIRGEAGGNLSDIEIGDGTIRKARPEVTLDLCGIAKGYALDRIATALTMLGTNEFVVELGGEVFARGLHPQGRPWRVAIEAPIPGVGAAQRIVHLDGQALATSGDTVNGFTFAGKRYSHLIDKRWSAPIDGDVASVSVVARNAMQADALATALMVMGPRRGSAFAAKHNISTLMLLRDGDGIREVTVAGFHRLLTV